MPFVLPPDAPNISPPQPPRNRRRLEAFALCRFLSADVRSVPRNHSGRPSAGPQGSRRQATKNGIAATLGGKASGRAGDRLRPWSGPGCENGGLSVENSLFSG